LKRVFRRSRSTRGSTPSITTHGLFRALFKEPEEGQPYELPREVEEKILRLMDYFVLNYGAIDIIVTPDGRHVFLEINSVGEFFRLEDCSGLLVSDAIADVLPGRSRRRR
jgi:glutathione synthase/RimK-type ligase-like ATP-grasp enzyme